MIDGLFPVMVYSRLKGPMGEKALPDLPPSLPPKNNQGSKFPVSTGPKSPEHKTASVSPHGSQQHQK